MLTNDSIVMVYNENRGIIYAESMMKEFGYKFEAIEDDVPYELPMPLSDIRYVNSRSAVFRDGILRIEADKEDEVLKLLGIVRKSENYITYEEIEDIILNPTAEKLEKFIQVTSVVTMDKIRNVLVELDNSDEYDISTRVFDVVNARFREINQGKRKSEIVIKKKKNEQRQEVEVKKEVSTKSKK